MKPWHVFDEGGSDPEERMSLLVVAETESEAVAIWIADTGLDPATGDCGPVVATVCEWKWPGVPPPPMPTQPGRWWPMEMTEHGIAYRGYGFSEEGDVRCEECDEYVDPSDATDDICRWCQAEARAEELKPRQPNPAENR